MLNSIHPKHLWLFLNGSLLGTMDLCIAKVTIQLEGLQVSLKWQSAYRACVRPGLSPQHWLKINTEDHGCPCNPSTVSYLEKGLEWRDLLCLLVFCHVRDQSKGTCRQVLYCRTTPQSWDLLSQCEKFPTLAMDRSDRYHSQITLTTHEQFSSVLRLLWDQLTTMDLFLFLFGGTGVWTQNFDLGKQAL
jgi:hypothetical protein